MKIATILRAYNFDNHYKRLEQKENFGNGLKPGKFLEDINED